MKNKYTLEQITNTVVNVQKQAIDLAEYDICSGVNIYARNAIRLLQSFGVNKEQLQDLIQETYADDIHQIDDSLADVIISVMTLSYMLSSDLQAIIYNRLCEIINAPNQHRVFMDVIQHFHKVNS